MNPQDFTGVYERALAAKPNQVHPLTKDIPKPLGMAFTPVDSLPRPLHDRVLVRREPETEQVGSIIIPETVREKCLKGEVLAVGPGRWIDGSFYPTQVKKGDRVLLSPSCNRNWPDIISGSGIIMVQEADLLGVIDE